jgi:hypothetical protein
MRYNVPKVLLILFISIPAFLNLWTFYDALTWVEKDFAYPVGHSRWLCGVYNLGLYLFLSTTSLLPIVPCLWIGAKDRGEIFPRCLVVFLVSLFALVCHWWIELGFFQMQSHPELVIVEGKSLGFLLIVAGCLLAILGWLLFQVKTHLEGLPLFARIIFRLQMLSCIFFVLATNIAFSWALPLCAK